MRTLVLTMLDLEQEPNQRTQHVARMLGELSRETVVASKVKMMDRSPRAMLRAALSCSVRAERSGSVTRLAISPPLNYAQGYAAGLVQGQLLERPGLARRAFAALLSALGMVRDALLAPTFVCVVLLRTRGVFDLCVVDGPWTATAAWLLRRLGRVRRFVYDDIDCVAGGQMLGLRRAYVAALERAGIRRADLVICAGWRLGDLRRRTTGRDVLVIPNGVDPARFAAARRKRPHPPTLVYVGHLSHYCGVDLAIRALPAIREQLPAARLVVVGDGDAPYVAGLEQLAQSLGVSHAVELRGRVPYADVPAVFAECDVGVSAFRATTALGEYAFPLKVVEYMAAGLPVICSAGTEGEEMLRRYRAGRAVEFTPESFAAAALVLLGDERVYAEASAAGVAASDVLTWERALADSRQAVLALVGESEARSARSLRSQAR